MQTGKTIAVVGATGLQGGVVTAHLLADGWKVKALTRDPDSERARALAAAGAQIVRAEMDDVASLVAAAEGAYGMFSVQPTVGSPGTAPDFTAHDEVRWGINVAEAAYAAGIEHLVFTSISGTGRHDSEVLPQNLVSKWRIEQRIAELGIPATILRPVSFMENYTGGYHLHDGTLATPLEPDVPQQIMAVDDVGVFAALAFARPKDWIGREIELAGDQLTPLQIAVAIAEAIGRPLPYVRIPIEAVRQVSEDFAYANEWLNAGGYQADIAAVRAIHPGLMDLRTWLANAGGAQISSFLAAQRAAKEDA